MDGAAAPDRGNDIVTDDSWTGTAQPTYTGNNMPLLRKQPESPRAAVRVWAPLDRHLDESLFKALGDPTRLRVLSCLIKCGRPCSVSEIAEICELDFSVVNKHLKILAAAEVLRSDKQGRTVWYAARCGELCDRLSRLIDGIVEWCPNLRGQVAPSLGKTCCGARRRRGA